MGRMLWVSVLVGMLLPAAAPAVPAQDLDCETEIDPDTPPLDTYLPRGSSAALENLRGNTISFKVRWTGNYYAGPRRIHVYLVGVTRKPGLNINTGSTLDPDFIFDADLNPAWNLPFEDGPAYDGLNCLQMVTKSQVEAYTDVPVVVSSYDFGGRATIYAEAEGCHASRTLEFPLDQDVDQLPDAWENGKYYWTEAGQRLPYLIGATVSPGITAGQDGDSDQDRDDRTTAVHGQLGDGLSAFDEYRGITVQGKPGRLEEHATDGPANGGPSGDKGGPDVKDLFIYDGQYTEGKGKNAASHDLFRKGNPFLGDFKIIWHKIKLNEMTSARGVAGDVNKNGGFTKQKAVWIANEAVSAPGRDLLGFSSNSVKDASKVKIDVADIRTLAAAAGGAPAFEDLLNWHVAHELGHKLSLVHPSTTRTYAAPTPAASATEYYPTDTKELRFWMPRTEAGTAKHDLEFVLDYAAKKATIRGRADVADLIAIHGVQHKCQLLTVDVMTNVQNAATHTVNLEGHKGFLLDPVIELETPQSLLNPADDRKNIKIRN